MNNEVLNAIKTRRSIRKYKAEQITDEQLDAILEAGTYAATGMGKQSPVIVGYNIRSVLRCSDRSDRAC